MFLETADGEGVTRPDLGHANPPATGAAFLQARVDLVIRYLVAEGHIDRCSTCMGNGYVRAVSKHPAAADAKTCRVCGGAGFLF